MSLGRISLLKRKAQHRRKQIQRKKRGKDYLRKEEYRARFYAQNRKTHVQRGFSCFEVVWALLPRSFGGRAVKNKKASTFLLKLSVVWAGIEPATQGFSVLCSTD